MPKLICVLIASLWTSAVLSAEVQSPRVVDAAAQAGSGAPDSRKIEKELQGLPWKQFRSVIEAVPKMKADVEAYGPVGWKYVEANYRRYGWKKNIDKLDDDQKKHLADLIRQAKGAN